MIRVAPFIRCCLTFALALLLPQAAMAEGIGLRTCLAPLAQASNPAAFDCAGKQTLHGPGDYVARLDFALVVSSPRDPLVLRFPLLWQDAARVNFHYADGAAETVAFSAAEAARHITAGGILQFDVPIRAASLSQVTIEVQDSGNYRGVVLGAEIMPRRMADKLHHRYIGSYAAFGGLALALLVFNFSLWTALRHRFQLHYCAMVAGLAVYAASASGLLMQLIPGIDGNDRLRINVTMLALFGVSALYFVRRFFDDSAFGPHLKRLIPAVSAAAMIFALWFAAMSPWHLAFAYRGFAATMMLMVLTLGPILASALRSQSRYVGLFVLAWAFPAGMALLQAAHGLGFVGYSFLLDNANLLALAAESLFSSLIVNARVRELSLQRDNAVAGERVARRLANTDPLTGLLNRRAFLDLAIGRSSTHRLMLIDIDRFKAVNDTLGHDAGDEVLVAIAGVIQQCRPARSLAVRLGGEEFGILLPVRVGHECPADGLLEAVRSHPMPLGANVTVSIGIADGKVISESDWKRLYRLADSALYRAKENGRDRACRVTDFRAVA